MWTHVHIFESSQFEGSFICGWLTVILNERGQNEKATYCMISTIWHSEKGKTAAAAKSHQSCPTLQPKDGSPPGSPSLGFSRQEHWSGLPFPSPMHESEKWSEVAQLCPTLRDPVDCSLPGSSAHGISQARVLEWVAIAFSEGKTMETTKTSGVAQSGG